MISPHLTRYDFPLLPHLTSPGFRWFQLISNHPTCIVISLHDMSSKCFLLFCDISPHFIPRHLTIASIISFLFISFLLIWLHRWRSVLLGLQVRALQCLISSIYVWVNKTQTFYQLCPEMCTVSCPSRQNPVWTMVAPNSKDLRDCLCSSRALETAACFTRGGYRFTQ